MSDVLHTAIRVTDLEAMRGFYEGTLGLDDAREFEVDGVTNYFVSGDGDAEIQFRYDPEDADPVEPAGIEHLAVEVGDVDDAVDACVAEWDSDIEREAETFDDLGLRAAFVTDPEGYVVELIEPM